MNYAYHTSTSRLVEHRGNAFGNFRMTLSYTPTAPPIDEKENDVLLEVADEFDILYFHGWFLWCLWGVLGFLQFASARYLKQYYLINMWIHLVSGLFIATCTIPMVVIAFYYYDWTMRDKFHNIIGLVAASATGLVVIGGFATSILIKYSSWKTHTIITTKYMH